MSTIQYRRGTAAEWAFVNPVLQAGEPGLETDTRRVKAGNGVDRWSDLQYLASEAASADWSSLTNTPVAFPPEPHAASHATSGSDAITPADIGAAPAASPTLSGTLTVAAGYAGAPALVSTTGTSDSGIYWPTADAVAISTAGTERLRVNSNGSIGIGFVGSASVGFRLHWKHTGNNYVSHISSPQIYSNAATSFNYWTAPSLKDSDSTYSSHTHYVANPIPSIPSGSTMGTEQAYVVGNSIQAWTVQGFVGKLNLVAGQTRHNVYCSGSAPNYFAGSVGIGIADPSGALDVNSDKIRVRSAKTPASATDTGNPGEICWDSSYIYVCVATNTWRRVAHSTW